MKKKNVKKKGKSSRLHNRLGALHIMRGEILLAISEFRKSLFIEPENIIALEKMAYLTSAMGEHEKSLEYYEKSVEIKPDDNDLLLGLANCYEINNRIEDALNVLEKMKKDKREVEKLDFYIARLCLKLEKTEEAKKAIELAKKASPDDGEILELEKEIKKAIKNNEKEIKQVKKTKDALKAKKSSSKEKKTTKKSE